MTEKMKIWVKEEVTLSTSVDTRLANPHAKL